MAKKSKKPSLVEQSTRREFLRKQQEAQRKLQARNRRIVIAVALVLAVVVVGVFTAVLVTQAQRAGGGTIVPPSANSDKTGIVANPTLAANAPHKVAVYLDYQCPSCASLEQTQGPLLETAAAAGTISLEYRTMTFLDAAGSNKSSTRAAVAAACADTVGAYAAYHNQVFANQPPQESTGFTTEQLRSTFPAAAGITGADFTAFQKCYDDSATQQFVQQVNDAAVAAVGASTPQVLVDGQAIDYRNLPNILASFQPQAPTTPGPASPSAPAAPSATP